MWLHTYQKRYAPPPPPAAGRRGGECITGRRRQKKKKKSPRPFNTVNAVYVHLLHLSASALSVQQIKAGEEKA